MKNPHYQEPNKKTVLVIGHKNPDTESICSAIAYAWLKNRLSERDAASVFISRTRTTSPMWSPR